jgi:hypothetical protein
VDGSIDVSYALYVCTYVSKYAHTHACMHVCVFVFMDLSIHPCMQICIRPMHKQIMRACVWSTFAAIVHPSPASLDHSRVAVAAESPIVRVVTCEMLKRAKKRVVTFRCPKRPRVTPEIQRETIMGRFFKIFCFCRFLVNNLKCHSVISCSLAGWWLVGGPDSCGWRRVRSSRS